MRCQLNELQRPYEFSTFVQILIEEKVTSYLEIGSRFGGSLWAVGDALPRNSFLTAVDINSTPELIECVTRLREWRDQNVKLIISDSTKKETILAINELPRFDAVFIDGDHHYVSVKSDWLNYGPLARKIVAFHDIGWPHEITLRKRPWKADVPSLWRQLKQEYKSREIIEDNGIGIGVLWPNG